MGLGQGVSPRATCSVQKERSSELQIPVPLVRILGPQVTKCTLHIGPQSQAIPHMSTWRNSLPAGWFGVWVGDGMAEPQWAGGSLCRADRSLPASAAPTPLAAQVPTMVLSCPGFLNFHFLLELLFQGAWLNENSRGHSVMHKSQCIKKCLKIPLPFVWKQVENKDWKPHCDSSMSLAGPGSQPHPQPRRSSPSTVDRRGSGPLKGQFSDQPEQAVPYM